MSHRELVRYAPIEDNQIHALIRGKPSYCKANIRVSTKQFQDRLAYLDKRYDHLRKMTHSLRKKVNELEDIMRLDNDEENIETIRRLLDDIKREKQQMRDEAHVIKGELSKTMYNEDLRRRRLAGEWKRIDEERKSCSATGSTTGDDDDTPSSSSMDGTQHRPYRETSM